MPEQPHKSETHVTRLDAEGWQSRYEAGETGWDRGECSPALTHWLESGELRPCRIFIPGCGRGYEVVELAARGFDVTALDFAETPVKHVVQQLGEGELVADVLQQDILHFATSDKFDAVYEQTSLCAIDPQDWPSYEQTIANILAPRGRLFALFMQSDSPGGPPFSCRLATMKSLFSSSRWEWPNHHFVVDHPIGMTEIAVVLRRRDATHP